MFGLPMSTTLIMGGIMAFWVVYTLVFYFSTSRWAVEDSDYASASAEEGADSAGDGSSPRAGRRGEQR